MTPPATRLSLTSVLLVGLGGAVGSLLRWCFSLVLPAHGTWNWPTLGVNLVGAMALGWLLTILDARGHDSPGLHRTRLLVGTGLLGGFSTYSTFAMEAWGLVDDGAVFAAVFYLAASLSGGLMAAWCGMSVASLCTDPSGRHLRSSAIADGGSDTASDAPSDTASGGGSHGGERPC